MDRYLKALPDVLNADERTFAELCAVAHEFNAVTCAYKLGGGLLKESKRRVDDSPIRAISVPDEEQLLGIGRRVLIEGIPGSGKTTLLRRLAVRLILQDEQVLFVSCAKLRAEHAGLSLQDITKEATLLGAPTHWRLEDSVLMVDALDEAPFDLSAKILESSVQPSRIVVTTRESYRSSLRAQFPTVEMEPFSAQERNAFLDRWFRLDANARQRAAELVQRHEDVDLHTRTPLVATLLGVLVEQEYYPTTRNAIYRDRLRLLLDQWDYGRGVVSRRMPIEPRMRFLEFLAFWAHGVRGRNTFTQDQMRHVYADALGKAGAQLPFDALVENLVVGSGVLVQERDRYSFGHLTFQEHLVALHMKNRLGAPHVARRLGDAWWRGVMTFYAGEKEDISELINHCEELAGLTAASALQLREMCGYARYTSAVADDIVASAAQHSVGHKGPRKGGAFSDEWDIDEPHDMDGRDDDALPNLRQWESDEAPEGDFPGDSLLDDITSMDESDENEYEPDCGDGEPE